MLQIENESTISVIDHSFMTHKLPFLVSVKTDIQAIVFTALDMRPLIPCFAYASSTCV
jgi:hypothetical protein